MAEGQTRERWAHTATLCALIANCHRDPKKHRPFRPADFDPFARRDQRPWQTTAPLSLLREALEASRQSGNPHPKGS